MKSPFPYFGGKSIIAPQIWECFGDPANYVEPFCGSAACLLARPTEPQIETINDADALLQNAWRSLKYKPDETAAYADDIVAECDLTAKHLWLVNRRENIECMMTEPEFCNPQAAGWWLWGISCWVGSGWCAQINETRLLKPARQRPHLGDAGKGVNRKLPHLSGAFGTGEMGIIPRCDELLEYFAQISNRLRRVRICCGDFERVLTPSVTRIHGVTAVFLDPPYDTSIRDKDIYTHDVAGVATRAREWAIANGNNPHLRIALCGYDGEHDMPHGWQVLEWKANGGYSSIGKGDTRGKANVRKERVWFSPHCLKPNQEKLFST